MKKSGIYLIKNIINNKVYVGSAVNIHKRWKEHKKHLKEGKHHSCHLQHAWDKHGEQNFKFEIIEEVSNPDHLLSYEQVYLDYYKSYEEERGYNICKVAGSQLGMKRTEETRQKMREAAKNISEETRQKMREASIGRKHTEETKQKLREANTGKKLSEETKQKLKKTSKMLGKKQSEETRRRIGEARRGRKHSEETKQRIREVARLRKHSEETKQKLRKINLGKKHSEETKNKMINTRRKCRKVKDADDE
jgi:group I intron endonuclease